jgi:hypothetical protein
MLPNLTNFILGAGLNLAVAVLIVRFIYYPVNQDKRYVFTFLAFNAIIYFVLSLLTSIELSVGVGFGLFAIFSVLRYRTEEVPIREMTYLFVVIALPVMNSALSASGDYGRVIIANGLMVALLYVLEREWGFRFETSQKITYDRIELIPPDQHPQLLADLRARTGLPVERVEVGRIDFSRDTAEVRVFYRAPARGRLAQRRPALALDARPYPEPADEP